MTFTILSCVPAYSLTNNDTDAKLETANPQKLDSAMPGNRTAGLQNPDLVVDISTSCSASIDDIDGDKIPNYLEVNGIDINNDNIIDLDLKKLGASPFHKDLFLEVDYMKYHKPIGNAINDTISSFANSPLCNPDGIDGIKLHVSLSEEVPHQNLLDMLDEEATTLDEILHFRDFYKIKSAYFGDVDERSDPNSKNILDAKKGLYHYGLFIHTVNDEKGLLGIAKDIPAYDFVVSLGAGDSPNSEGHLTGTESEQESTFMHEFGHTIGLYHGGSDPDINNKPNYISIMNYLITNAIVADSKLDFSRCALDALNERSLEEQKGITGKTNSCSLGEKTAFYNACAWHPRVGYYGIDPQLIETGNSVDWATPVQGIDNIIKQKNINCDQDRNGQRYTTEMKGYEDWHNLIFLPTTLTTTGNTSGDLSGESPVQSSNKVTQNLNPMQTNNTNDDIKIKTLLGDEPTRTDIRFQTLGVLAGITSYIENNINESSFQEPTADLQGNPIPSDPFAGEGEVDPAAAGKEYYQAILGDPLFLLDPAEAESGLGAEEEHKDNVANNIMDGDIDSAIEKLDKLVLASDSSLGGVSNNDRITEPSDQQELLEKIGNLQNILKKQSCTYDRCN
jgi:hypothetical protein